MNAPGGGGPLRLRSSDPGGGGGGLKHALPTSSFNLSAKSVNRSNAAFTSFTSIPSPLPSPLSSPLSSIVSSLSLLFMSSSSDPSPDPSSSSAKAAKTITSIISAVTSQRAGSVGRMSGHETYGKLNRPISAALHIKISMSAPGGGGGGLKHALPTSSFNLSAKSVNRSNAAF